MNEQEQEKALEDIIFEHCGEELFLTGLGKAMQDKYPRAGVRIEKYQKLLQDTIVFLALPYSIMATAKLFPTNITDIKSNLGYFAAGVAAVAVSGIAETVFSSSVDELRKSRFWEYAREELPNSLHKPRKSYAEAAFWLAKNAMYVFIPPITAVVAGYNYSENKFKVSQVQRATRYAEELLKDWVTRPAVRKEYLSMLLKREEGNTTSSSIL